MSDDLEHASPLDLLTARPPIVAPFSAINPEPRGCRIVVGLPPAAPPVASSSDSRAPGN